ncbi:hypothetical protein PoB_004381100 [Plakobranchus ocellatus]|uniref:Uncharacterized protein n=1 Tax=Plakobranchus ocellatus TaxID=259542 RepID=A0AAV4B1R2_9GAST|nr:hypothetical protein PoB_004381100 [Plakobranchus ocellatus]
MALNLACIYDCRLLTDGTFRTLECRSAPRGTAPWISIFVESQSTTRRSQAFRRSAWRLRRSNPMRRVDLIFMSTVFSTPPPPPPKPTHPPTDPKKSDRVRRLGSCGSNRNGCRRRRRDA